MQRRTFLKMGAAATAWSALDGHLSAQPERRNMYGLISKITTVSGKREELISILLQGTANMPGCLSYIVARDNSDPDGIWTTEVWDSKQSHAASLSLPSVKDALARGKPLIAGFGNRVETIPVGGQGLQSL
jgi:quinol monooxygenase YgiN